MTVYYCLIALIALTQTLALILALSSLRFAFTKYRPRPTTYTPHTALISPCKGIDTTFDRNIQALFDLDYTAYELFFVVESTDDPAYPRLQRLIEQNKQKRNAQIIIAGTSTQRVQKVHNLLAAVNQLPQHIEALAFVDSDACPKPHFLGSLIYPLQKKGVGSSTGHRWFVPTDHHPASITLSVMNAFMATQLGRHRWNANWGGAMAIMRDTFDNIDVRRYWQNACTDDYTMTVACRAHKLRVYYNPACFVPSYEATTWSKLFHFARRQFLITRINMPILWLTCFVGLGQFLLGFWGGLIMALLLTINNHPMAGYAFILPAAIYLLHIAKALGRQLLMRRILPEDRRQMLIPALVDVFAAPLVHLYTYGCLIASALSRTVVWRNIRYTFHRIDHTEITKIQPKQS